MKCGGTAAADTNNEEIISAFKKVIEQENEKNSTSIEFVKIINATTQVVSGAMYEGDVETTDGNYHIKVWVQLWLNSYKVQEFRKL